jgi:hypothetical protein
LGIVNSPHQKNKTKTFYFLRALKQSDYFTEWDNSQEGNVMDSKVLATTAHKLLKEMGHELPLGHVYELFSKLSGHKSWNVAKTKDGFEPVLRLISPKSVGEGNYEVKVTLEEGSIELKKYYKVQAQSEKEAESIVSNYIKYRICDFNSEVEIEQFLFENEGVRILSELESEDDYLYENWEVIWNDCVPQVQAGSTLFLFSEHDLVKNHLLGKMSKDDFKKQLKAKMR